ncbi:CLIP domain-containing serine protease B8-like [Ochlerotatus camptorhynchus]|uniref:CLIP domain-containing serine protease B8-like n=1 Tax=Ochlerotatus camptorhynchus TaxID=644619 RepID=UPI0031DDF811
MAPDSLTRFFSKLVLAVIVLTGSSSQQDAVPVLLEYDACDIPNEAEKGICVKPQDCQAFQNIIIEEELCSIGTFSFVKALQCESTDETRVCCPQSGAYKDPQLSSDVPRLERNPRPIMPLLFDLCYSCGQEVAFKDRIVGGKIADIDEFPWATLLFYRNNRQGCGGVLISRTFVMTAAHCLAGPNYDQLGPLHFVRLREYNTESDPDCTVLKTEFENYRDCNEEKIDARPKSIRVHPNYDPYDIQLYNDIGLIELDRAVEYTDFLQPVCLPRTGLRVGLAERTIFQVCGWGRTNFFNKLKGTVSPIKMKASLPFVKAEDCMKAYESQQLDLGPGQFCAGGRKGVDTCAGDSGSPLMFFDRVKETWVLSGIVSKGPTSCGTTNKPGIYTNVKYYLPWILQNAI